MADKQPKIEEADEFGFEPAPAAEAKAQEPDEFGFEPAPEAPPAEELKFDSVAADDPRVQLRDITPVAADEGTMPTPADRGQSFMEGAVEGGFLNMHAPLDYAKATGDYITAAVDPNRDANFDESLDMARSHGKALAARTSTSHTLGQVTGAVGTALLGSGPVAALAKGATGLGARLGASVAGTFASGAAQGVARLGLFARAAGFATQKVVEGGIATSALGAAAVLDQAIETGDTESLAQKMAAGAIHEFKTGALFNLGLGIVGAAGSKLIRSLPTVADFASGRAFKALGGKKSQVELAEMRVKGGTRAVGRAMLDEGIITHTDPTLEGTLARGEIVQEQLGQELGKLRDQVGGLHAAPSASALYDKIEREVIAPLKGSPIKRELAQKIEGRLRYLKDELTVNRPPEPVYDSLGMEVAPKGASYAEAGLRPATAEDLALRDRLRAAPRAAGETSAESLAGVGVKPPATQYDSMGMPLGPSISAEVPAVPREPWRITGVKPAEAPLVPVPGEMSLAPDTITHDRLTALRIDVDDTLAQFDSLSEKPAIEAYRKLRRVMNNYWIDSAETAARQANRPELVPAIQEMSQRYARVTAGNELLRDTVARRLTNRTFGMSDTQLGQAGAGIGALAGSVAGPVGTAVGGTLGAAIGGVGNKIVREQGNQFMSSVLDKAAKRTIQVQQKLQNASMLKGLTRPKAVLPISEAAHIQAGPLPAHAVDKAIEQADQLQDPESDASENLGASLQHMEVEAGPEITKALQEHAMAQAQFLLDKAGPLPPPSPFGGAQTKRTFDEETQAQLGRYVRALEEPMAALDRVSEGVATSEDREVLQAPFNASIWQEFQQRSVSELAERGKELPYDQQLAVADALDLPLVPALDGSYQNFWGQVSLASQMQAQAKAEAKAKLQGGKGVRSKADSASA
jgi:hypothetical protein